MAFINRINPFGAKARESDSHPLLDKSGVAITVVYITSMPIFVLYGLSQAGYFKSSNGPLNSDGTLDSTASANLDATKLFLLTYLPLIAGAFSFVAFFWSFVVHVRIHKKPPHIAIQAIDLFFGLVNLILPVIILIKTNNQDQCVSLMASIKSNSTFDSHDEKWFCSHLKGTAIGHAIIGFLYLAYAILVLTYTFIVKKKGIQTGTQQPTYQQDHQDVEMNTNVQPGQEYRGYSSQTTKYDV